MPVIGGAFSCGFSKAADSVIGIILGLAQRNRGRKTSDPDACGASAAPGKMRTAASRNQRRAGKIVPGFQLGYFSLAHRTGCVGKADGSNSTTAVPVHRFETGRQRLRSCRRWLRLLERDAGFQAIAALNGAPSISPVSTPHRHALPSAAVATTRSRACSSELRPVDYPDIRRLPDSVIASSGDLIVFVQVFGLKHLCTADGRPVVCSSSRKPATNQAKIGRMKPF